MSRTDAELVAEALFHIEILENHQTLGSYEDDLVADAVNLRLSAAIEAISQATPEFRDRYFPGQWHEMKALRNLISHGYLFIDNAVVKSTLERDLPGFKSQLLQAQSDFTT